jgi:flagellar motor switch protein FliG
LGAPPALASRVLGELLQAEAERIRRELNSPGPLRLSDVEEARQQIAELARYLAAQGRISFRRATASRAPAPHLQPVTAS